jgi:hypothetical protein
MPPVPVLCEPYDGVVVGDAILCMLIVGFDCCCGGANDGLPIPGLLGAIAGNEELRVLKVLSGVIARLCDLGALSDVLLGGGRGVTGGVDQENVAAGDALLEVLERLLEECDGKTVEDDADAEPFAHGSPPSISVPLEELCCPPRTRVSKSASPPPLAVSKPFDVLGPPKLMNSLRVVAVALLAPSSCSLRVCSLSTRADMDLINVI